MSGFQDDSHDEHKIEDDSKREKTSTVSNEAAATPGVEEEANNSSAVTSKKPIVHFDPSQVKALEEEKEKTKKPKQPFRHSRRVVIGDGKGNPIRDLFVFLAIVGALFGVSFLLSPSGDDDKKNKDQNAQKKRGGGVKIPFGETLNKLQQNFATSILEHMEPFRRKEDCRIFISPGGSSVPTSTAAGLFAGKFYEPGDVVLETSTLVPIVMPMTMAKTATATATTTLEQQPPSYHLLSSYALLLQFHPTLANIEGTTVFLQNTTTTTADVRAFRAIRPIRPGDELFLSMEQHPLGILSKTLENNNNPEANANADAVATAAQSFFSHIPMQKDYEMAHELIIDIHNIARQMEVAHGRRINNGMSGSIDTTYLLVLTRKIVAKFDDKVSRLLPQSKLDWTKRKKTIDHVPTHLACLKNKTLEQLQRTASCMSDIQKVVIHNDGDSDSDDDHSSVVAAIVTRNVNKNEHLAFIPLQAIRAHSLHPRACRVEEADGHQEEQHEQCEWSTAESSETVRPESYFNNHVSNCFGGADSLLLLCPLTDFAWISLTTAREANITTTTTANPKPHPEPNVHIKWRKSDMTKPTVDEILSSGALQNLWWEVTALRDINSGEKLVMKGGESTIQDQPRGMMVRSLPDKLIPRHWRRPT